MEISVGNCQTIDQVIAQLDQIIDHCSRKHNKLGYFATLYRNVTVRVREDIIKGRFEDGPRMERLDVVFANRYLDALDEYWNGHLPTHSWHVVFKTAHTKRPIILQHLLLGMNAHINLDLAIAAAQTAPGSQIASLKKDFYEITVLLDEMIQSVQQRIDRVSPWFRFIDAVGGRTDRVICAFAIGEARVLAWDAAEKFARLSDQELAKEVAFHDKIVAELGEAIRSPFWPLNAGLLIIRARETHHVAKVIQALRL